MEDLKFEEYTKNDREDLIFFLDSNYAHPYCYPDFFELYNDNGEEGVVPLTILIGKINNKICFSASAFLYLNDNIIEFPHGPVWSSRKIMREGINTLCTFFKQYEMMRIQPYGNFDSELNSFFLEVGFIATNKPWQEYTVEVDLSESVETLYQNFRKTQRYFVRYAQRNQYQFCEIEEIEACSEFVKEHNEMARKKNYGQISSKYLEKLYKISNSQFQGKIFQLRNKEGLLTAGALILYTNTVGWYQRGFSTREKGIHSCSAYLHLCIMAYLKEKGVKKYDLAGIMISDKSGVSDFKKSLDKSEVVHKFPQYEIFLKSNSECKN